MAKTLQLLTLLLILVFANSFILQGYGTQVKPLQVEAELFSSPQRKIVWQGKNEIGRKRWWRSMKMKIGSTTPICTYNECKGCKYKCRAEQVPVEGNEPINSAYHYRCVCHR